MEKIIVKLLENPENPKLKMKYVGAIDYATPKIGKDGKVITGLDELSLDIIMMSDGPEKKKLQGEIKKEREHLEKILGIELGPHSDFWNSFFIPLSDEEFYLDPLNPMDRLKEKFLVANRYAAPSKEDIYNNEDFNNCIFYLFREEEEMSKKATKQKRKDHAKSKLYILNEENPNKLKIVAAYLFGFANQSELTVDKAYSLVTEFIEDKDETIQRKNIEIFLDIASKTPEELSTKLILDKAIKKRIITSKNKIYRRGDFPLGNSYEEALEYLSSPENSGELHSLIKEVDKI